MTIINTSGSYLGVERHEKFLVQKRKIDAFDSVFFRNVGVVRAYKDPLVDGTMGEFPVQAEVANNGAVTFKVKNNPFQVITVALAAKSAESFDPPSKTSFSNVHFINIDANNFTITGNTVAIVVEGQFESSIGFSNSTSNNATLDANCMPIPIVTTTPEANSVTITGSGKILVFEFGLVPL